MQQITGHNALDFPVSRFFGYLFSTGQVPYLVGAAGRQR
jgi:hypothetical protein